MFVYLVFFTNLQGWLNPNGDSEEVLIDRQVTTKAESYLLTEALREKKPEMKFKITGALFLRQE